MHAFVISMSVFIITIEPPALACGVPVFLADLACDVLGTRGRAVATTTTMAPSRWLMTTSIRMFLSTWRVPTLLVAAATTIGAMAVATAMTGARTAATSRSVCQ